MAYRSFEALQVWQRACCLAMRVYGVLRDGRIELVQELKEISAMLQVFSSSFKLKA